MKVAAGAVRDLANDYLANLNTYQYVDFEVLRNDKKQDMITVIPEPGSAMLAVFSTLALAMRRRRK